MNNNIGYFLNLEANQEQKIIYNQKYASISYKSNNEKNYNCIIPTIKTIGKYLEKYSINLLWINTIDNKVFKGYDKSRNIFEHLKIYSKSNITILVPNLLYNDIDTIARLEEMLERQWCRAEIIVSKNIYIWDGEKINHWNYYKDFTRINDFLITLTNIKNSTNLKNDIIDIIKTGKSNINMEHELINSILYLLKNQN